MQQIVEGWSVKLGDPGPQWDEKMLGFPVMFNISLRWPEAGWGQVLAAQGWDRGGPDGPSSPGSAQDKEDGPQ